MKPSITKNKTPVSKPKKAAYALLAAFFWLAVWQLAYLLIGKEILIVSPASVLFQLSGLIKDASFWYTIGASMLRILIGYLIAVFLGIVIALLSFRVSFFYAIFQPMIQIIKATPVASFIILALFFLKSTQVPTFAASLIVLPVIVSNLLEGFHATDPKLLEMAAVYQIPQRKQLRAIYLPSVMPYFISGCNVGMGMAWKAGIAAEVLSVPLYAIGTNIYQAKIYLDTLDLFAWTAVVILLSVLLEKSMQLLFHHLLSRFHPRKERPYDSESSH